MSGKARVNLVVLFPSELRLAATLVEKVRNLPKDTPQEEAVESIKDAIRACDIALWHVSRNPEATIVVGSDPEIEEIVGETKGA